MKLISKKCAAPQEANTVDKIWFPERFFFQMMKVVLKYFIFVEF